MDTFKSVLKLYAAVQRANPKEPIELRRTGARTFGLRTVPGHATGHALGGGGIAVGDDVPREFVFGQGFVPKGTRGRTPKRGFTGKDHAETFDAGPSSEGRTWFASGARNTTNFRKHRRPSRASLLIVSGVTASLTIAAVYLAMPVHNPNGAKVKLAVSPSLQANPSCAGALEQAEMFIAGKAEIHLIADESLGGVRQITFTDACTQKLVQVRLFKIENAWKAKSATPMGSHSLD